MARGWPYTKPSLASAPLCDARMCVCAVHPLHFCVSCASLHPTYPFWHLLFVLFVCIPIVFFVVFYLICVLCFRWSFGDVPLIFSSPVDLVPDWHVCSFGLRVVHCLAQRSIGVLFDMFIKGPVRKNEDREKYKERVKDRASASKSSA